jgi:hypothetical protein
VCLVVRARDFVVPIGEFWINNVHVITITITHRATASSLSDARSTQATAHAPTERQLFILLEIRTRRASCHRQK